MVRFQGGAPFPSFADRPQHPRCRHVVVLEPALAHELGSTARRRGIEYRQQHDLPSCRKPPWFISRWPRSSLRRHDAVTCHEGQSFRLAGDQPFNQPTANHPRFAETHLVEALADTPVVFIHGPRQCGKTTLARVAGDRRGYAYFSFDDPAALAAAKADPNGFVTELPARTILDEVQRVPELFSPLKLAVDRHPTPGRFMRAARAQAGAPPATGSTPPVAARDTTDRSVARSQWSTGKARRLSRLSFKRLFWTIEGDSHLVQAASPFVAADAQNGAPQQGSVLLKAAPPALLFDPKQLRTAVIQLRANANQIQAGAHQSSGVIPSIPVQGILARVK